MERGKTEGEIAARDGGKGWEQMKRGRGRRDTELVWEREKDDWKVRDTDDKLMSTSMSISACTHTHSQTNVSLDLCLCRTHCYVHLIVTCVSL